MKKRGKRYQAVEKLIDREKEYDISQAVELVKKAASAKFDETVNVSFHLRVDPKQSDQQVRGVINLPHGTGKTVRIVAFVKGDNADKAKQAGADFVGDKDLMDKIGKGWLDFDVVVATPDMMKEISKLGKVLGPRGLMPNPKSGTVASDIAGAIKEIKAGKVEYRLDKGANLHIVVGKASFSQEQLSDNIQTTVREIIQAKPVSCKGQYLKNLTISSAMGPSVRLNAQSIK
ncbi:50S ribosomal protein L1 [bacterium]|nr:50S ribosomal protein L1 [bacterium]